jgi:hypothetical protein
VVLVSWPLAEASRCRLSSDRVESARPQVEHPRAFGTILLAGVFFAAGLAGIAALWAVWPRSSNTSPLAALFALLWSCTYILTAILTWRRSRFAAFVFLAAAGLLVFPARFIVPDGQFFLPSFVVISLVAFVGYSYLRRVREPAV